MGERRRSARLGGVAMGAEGWIVNAQHVELRADGSRHYHCPSTVRPQPRFCRAYKKTETRTLSPSCSSLCDPPVHDGVESVRDRDHRHVGKADTDHRLQLFVRRHVNARCCLVEHEDARAAQHGAAEAEELALALRCTKWAGYGSVRKEGEHEDARAAQHGAAEAEELALALRCTKWTVYGSVRKEGEHEDA
eukprot:364388-Chlamydomonas_euryale.AAC.11